MEKIHDQSAQPCADAQSEFLQFNNASYRYSGEYKDFRKNWDISHISEKYVFLFAFYSPYVGNTTPYQQSSLLSVWFDMYIDLPGLDLQNDLEETDFTYEARHMTLFWILVRDDDVELQAFLVEQQFPRNTLSTLELCSEMDEHGYTPLHYACLLGSLKCVKALIEIGVNVHAKTTYRLLTPLYCAVCSHTTHQKEIVDQLLSQKANPVEKSSKLATPLHAACLMGDTLILNVLLQHTPPSTDMSSLLDAEKRTPLHLAGLHSDCLTLLLDVLKLPDNHECFLDEDLRGWNVMHYSISAGQLDSVALLLDKCPTLLTATTGKGISPVLLASSIANKKITQRLLPMLVEMCDGAEDLILVLQHKVTGVHIQHIACSQTDVTLYRIKPSNTIAQKGSISYIQEHMHLCDTAEIQEYIVFLVNTLPMLLRQSDKSDCYPQHYAAYTNHVHQLLRSQEDQTSIIQAQNILNQSPLFYALWGGAVEAATLLLPLTNTSVYETEVKNRMNLLQAACLSGRYGCISLLLEKCDHKFDSWLNVVTEKGATPLYLITHINLTPSKVPTGCGILAAICVPTVQPVGEEEYEFTLQLLLKCSIDMHQIDENGMPVLNAATNHVSTRVLTEKYLQHHASQPLAGHAYFWRNIGFSWIDYIKAPNESRKAALLKPLLADVSAPLLGEAFTRAWINGQTVVEARNILRNPILCARHSVCRDLLVYATRMRDLRLFGLLVSIPELKYLHEDPENSPLMLALHPRKASPVILLGDDAMLNLNSSLDILTVHSWVLRNGASTGYSVSTPIGTKANDNMEKLVDVPARPWLAGLQLLCYGSVRMARVKMAFIHNDCDDLDMQQRLAEQVEQEEFVSSSLCLRAIPNVSEYSTRILRVIMPQPCVEVQDQLDIPPAIHPIAYINSLEDTPLDRCISIWQEYISHRTSAQILHTLLYPAKTTSMDEEEVLNWNTQELPITYTQGIGEKPTFPWEQHFILCVCLLLDLGVVVKSANVANLVLLGFPIAHYKRLRSTINTASLNGQAQRQYPSYERHHYTKICTDIAVSKDAYNYNYICLVSAIASLLPSHQSTILAFLQTNGVKYEGICVDVQTEEFYSGLPAATDCPYMDLWLRYFSPAMHIKIEKGCLMLVELHTQLPLVKRAQDAGLRRRSSASRIGGLKLSPLMKQTIGSIVKAATVQKGRQTVFRDVSQFTEDYMRYMRTGLQKLSQGGSSYTLRSSAFVKLDSNPFCVPMRLAPRENQYWQEPIAPHSDATKPQTTDRGTFMFWESRADVRSFADVNINLIDTVIPTNDYICPPMGARDVSLLHIAAMHQKPLSVAALVLFTTLTATANPRNKRNALACRADLYSLFGIDSFHFSPADYCTDPQTLLTVRSWQSKLNIVFDGFDMCVMIDSPAFLKSFTGVSLDKYTHTEQEKDLEQQKHCDHAVSNAPCLFCTNYHSSFPENYLTHCMSLDDRANTQWEMSMMGNGTFKGNNNLNYSYFVLPPYLRAYTQEHLASSSFNPVHRLDLQSDFTCGLPVTAVQQHYERLGCSVYRFSQTNAQLDQLVLSIPYGRLLLEAQTCVRSDPSIKYLLREDVLATAHWSLRASSDFSSYASVSDMDTLLPCFQNWSEVFLAAKALQVEKVPKNTSQWSLFKALFVDQNTGCWIPPPPVMGSGTRRIQTEKICSGKSEVKFLLTNDEFTKQSSEFKRYLQNSVSYLDLIDSLNYQCLSEKEVKSGFLFKDHVFPVDGFVRRFTFPRSAQQWKEQRQEKVDIHSLIDGVAQTRSLAQVLTAYSLNQPQCLASTVEDLTWDSPVNMYHYLQSSDQVVYPRSVEEINEILFSAGQDYKASYRSDMTTSHRAEKQAARVLVSATGDVKYEPPRTTDTLIQVHAADEVEEQTIEADPYAPGNEQTRIVLRKIRWHKVVDCITFKTTAPLLNWFYLKFVFLERPYFPDVPDHLNALRAYAGEAVAFYFLFSTFTIYYLFPLVFCGLGFTILHIQKGLDTSAIAWYAVILMFWSTFYIEYCSRKQTEISMHWGRRKFLHIEPISHNFKPNRHRGGAIEMRPNDISGQPEPHYPLYKTHLKVFASVLITLAFMVLVAAQNIYVLLITPEGLDWEENLTIVGISVASAITTQIAKYVYEFGSVELTKWENHKYDSHSNISHNLKFFAFVVVTEYFSLFYIMLGFTTTVDVTTRLFVQACSSVVISVFSNVAIHQVYPWVKFTLMIRKYRCFLCCKRKRASHLVFIPTVMLKPKPVRDVQDGSITSTDGSSSETTVKLAKLTFQQHVELNCSGHPNAVTKILSHTPFVTTMDQRAHLKLICATYMEFLRPKSVPLERDYLNTILLLGYVVGFAAIFPLGPIIVVLALWAKRQGDVWRLLNVSQRNSLVPAKNIGYWYIYACSFLSYLSIISNGIILFYTTDAQAQSYFSKSDTDFIFACYLLVVITFKSQISRIIDDVAWWVRVEEKRSALFAQNIIK